MKKIIIKIFFPIIGLISLIWFLFRVVPKPSRATYPCMRVAYPIASSFVIYFLGLVTSAFAFGKMKEHWKYSHYWTMIGFLVIALITGFFSFQADQPPVYANTSNLGAANAPIGEAKGIYPGRVVWVHDAAATNQNCVPGSYGHGWFLPENNNQTVVDGMVSSAIQNLTGQITDSVAWRAIFEYHNTTRGKGAVNYAVGEKIFIKINATSSWSGNYNTSDLSKVYNSNYGNSETSPAIVLSVLRHLVNKVGVSQTDIYIGDPMKHIYKHCYDLWHAEFPNVHYLDNSYSTLGREKATASTTAKIHYSDHGAVLRANVWDPGRPGGSPIYNDYLYTILSTAEYVINLPMLKGHQRAGITAFAKNNFGSQTRADASQLHDGLVAPMQMPNGITRPGYGLYRVQVDFMTHSLTGKKNLFYLMDALWATDYEADVPLKWQMAPFNNDWMSSIFASFDPVAIESVGYDFLRSEFTAARGNCSTVVQMDGVDDYLHQAADSLNWASGIKYDPDSNGVHIKSLGTHEHWNNAIDKQYTRNLGTGEGIELISIDNSSLLVQLVSFEVTLKETQILLVWKTASEENNYGFEVERRAVVGDQSSMTNTWQKIGFVAGNGSSNIMHEYSFSDPKLMVGRYAYRLKQIDNDGTFTYSTSIEVQIGAAPTIFSLSQNYPNPFNPSTVIRYQITSFCNVHLEVFDMLGREVKTLVIDEQSAGCYSVTFNAHNLPSGTYFYRLQAGSFVDTKKLIVLK